MLYHALNDTISEIDRTARRWCVRAGLVALLVLFALALFIVPAQAADGAYATLDSTGKGTVLYPELEASSHTVCLPDFECLGGSRQYAGEPYEILLYEDGSGWLSVGDSRTQFCMAGWDCDTQLPDPCEADPQALECLPAEEPNDAPLPNPCDADPTAPECMPTEEPPILAPVCTSDWCGKLFLPAVMAQYATILGDGEGAGPICSRPDCTQ